MRRFVAVLLGLAAALAGAELLAAGLRPPARFQVIHASRQVRLDEVEGVVLWDDARIADRRRDCRGRPGAVGIFGSSILAGSGLDAEEVFSARLGVCADNRASPGYAAETQLARLRRDLPEMGVARVIWELWSGAIHHYDRVGDKAIGLMGAAVPRGPLGWLLGHSRVAEALWLARLEPPRRLPIDPVERYLPDVLEPMAATVGRPWLLLIPPPLHRPFAESVADPHPVAVAATAWARAHGVPVLDLAEAFGDTPVESVRLDPCCHYNAEGQRRIASFVEAALP